MGEAEDRSGFQAVWASALARSKRMRGGSTEVTSSRRAATIATRLGGSERLDGRHADAKTNTAPTDAG